MGAFRRPLVFGVRWWAGGFVVPVGLYLVAVVVLLWGLNTQPNYVYNWENNTLQGLYPFVEQPSLGPFRLLEGLMTDSIASPWTIFPAWVSWGLFGPSLQGLRAPIALLAAFAVPLLYVLTLRTLEIRSQKSEVRRVALAVVAALLLALSPAFMLYARTATVVGVSVAPALLTVLGLYGVLRRPDLWWRSAGLLGMLMAGGYAYAPIRFLWPMCVVVLFVEAFLRRKDNRRSSRRLVASALLLIVGMAGFITAFDFEHEHGPIVSVGYYYSGRGEQIANLIVNVEMYNTMINSVDPAAAPRAEELAWDLFTHNVSDMTSLFLDIDTKPALSDYWNPHGRLIPWWFAPLMLAGFLRAAWLGFRRKHVRWRIVVLFFLGFTLPMLLTSQVHIGRLIFAIPFICMFVAFGVDWAADLIGRLVARLSKRAVGTRGNFGRAVLIGFSAILIVVVGYSTWNDYTVEPMLTYEAAVTQLLRGHIEQVKELGGGVALVTNGDSAEKLNLESINSNQYKLMLRSLYHVTNLATGDIEIRRPGDTRSAIYIGGLMDRLKVPESIPTYCTNLYYVAPAFEATFKELMDAHKELCSVPIIYRLLP